MADQTNDTTSGAVNPTIQKWAGYAVLVVVWVVTMLVTKQPQPMPPLPQAQAPVIVNCPYPASVQTPAAK